MYTVPEAKRLQRLLKIKYPNHVDQREINQLVYRLGIYGVKLKELKEQMRNE